jgi:alpha-beta hydrolase superfamily lysophospholipase
MSPCSIDTFAASDGYPLRYRCYEPSCEPRATIVGIHGIQSHGGWYEYSCTKLCEAGFRVFYLDRRGSGLNEQARGDTPTFGRLLDDLAEFVRSAAVVRAVPHGLPVNDGGKVFLAAVSWGGKLAVALQRWQEGLVDGLMLLCPGLFPQVGLAPSRQLEILGARLISPGRLFPIPLDDPELFTTSPCWRDFIHADPLALHCATARFFVESFRLDRYLRTAPSHVTSPLLLVLAGQDRIIRNDKTQRFFHKFGTADKNVITYGEAHHTLEFEPDPDRFIAEMVRWIDRQCRVK